MAGNLVSCPVCSRQISAAAKACISCGHPLTTRGAAVTYAVWFLIISAGVALGAGIYKIGIFNELAERSSQSASPLPKRTENLVLSDAELASELQGYVLRANRTLPHKPNPMLTLVRIYYKPKPHRLTYDYELNVAAGISGIDLSSVRPALMRRYCYDDDFGLPSSNGVSVTWRYLELGRVVHEETIRRCELG